MIIDNILVDWQSSKKVISFPTLVISFVRSYQFSDTCHSNNSSHISDQCGQKKFIYFCWPIIFYSWYIFWYHMGLGTSKNIIIYLWFTLNVMYPNEACYTYQFCEIFSTLSHSVIHFFQHLNKVSPDYCVQVAIWTPEKKLKFKTHTGSLSKIALFTVYF